jgi:hypothetical protein
MEKNVGVEEKKAEEPWKILKSKEKAQLKENNG